eukprot:SAG11_NODE_18199_length_497_cov_1.278894_1_plen_31_part_10
MKIAPASGVGGFADVSEPAVPPPCEGLHSVA